MTKPKRLKLKDVRASWVRGELHRNGKTITEEQVKLSLINKHLKLYGTLPGYVSLSPDDIDDIIYNDRSRHKQHPEDKLKVTLKKLEVESKVLDIKLKKEEFRQGFLKAKLEADKKLQKLLKESHPSQYNLDMYQRTPVQYCVLAIQSEHPDLSDKQCKMILGSWVRKGY